MRIVRNCVIGLVLVLLSVGGWSCRSHDSAFSEEGVLRASARQLQTTVVTPHTQVPIPGAVNVLWCGTFQLAWNELARLAGGRVQFTDPVPAAEALGREPFGTADLDEGSYVAVAGFVRDGVFRHIDAELRRKFSGQAAPRLKPDPTLTPRPQDIAVYAYLFKHLEFAAPYERGEAPVPFSETHVACFGMGTEPRSGREAMARQTLIVDYQSADDFVVELRTKVPEDQLILAKVRPGRTLADTIAAVQKRLAVATVQPAQLGDVLVVPKINFDLTASFPELLGQRLLSTAPGMADDLQILAADQATRFQLDEKGVRLKSEARMSLGCSASAHPRPAHVMVFDKPFLVLMKRRDAVNPYFALWVANAELLVKTK
jgi:hypothetical protein